MSMVESEISSVV